MSDTAKPVRKDAASLEATIDKAKEVAADLRRAADNLAIANTVLGQELPAEVQTGEVAQALEHTDAVEKKLAKSSDSLDEVNAELDKVATVASPGR